MRLSSQTKARTAKSRSMSGRSMGRGMAVVLLGSTAAALACAALLYLAAGWQGPKACSGPVGEGAWTARSRACFVPSGFHRPEFDPDAERHFSWTEASAELRFPRLDRARPHRLTLTVGASRPPGGP